MEAIGNVPTAADYAWNLERANAQGLSGLAERFRQTDERRELAEEKLKFVSYIVQSLREGYNDGYTASRYVARSLREILDCATLEDLRKLREQE